MLVLDCSATMPWVLEDEESTESDAALNRLQTKGAFVPRVWPLEVRDALLVAVRRGRLARQQSERFVAGLEDLPITADDAVRGVFRAAQPLAGLHGVSSYDAAYLELARRKTAPLATIDAGLARTARAAGGRPGPRGQSPPSPPRMSPRKPPFFFLDLASWPLDT